MFLGFQEIYKLSHADPVRNVISVKKSDSLPPCVDCRFRHRWIPILFVRPQPKLASISQDLVAILQVQARDDFSHVEAYGPFTQ